MNSRPDLDLSPIGNGAVNALINAEGAFVWSCLPRPDGEPVFSRLLEPRCAASGEAGLWSITCDDLSGVEQGYLRNTAVLRTVQRDQRGNEVEIVDFAPRLRQFGRIYRPAAFFRIVRPLKGSPRITMRLRPTADHGARQAAARVGSSHVSYDCGSAAIRLTTNAPISHIVQERTFRLESPLAFYLGPDEPYPGDIAADADRMLAGTCDDWREWVRTLSLPLDWQEAVIRAAIALKLCMFEETGAIIAAMTTSIPEAPNTQRNWDYRYCWIRDAYYVVRALNRLGAADMLENYLLYLRNLVDQSAGGDVQPVFGVGLEADLDERIAEGLAGYRGMGPVRVGNQAHKQRQNDVYGQIVLPLAQSFFDHRLLRMGTAEDFASLEQVGERAWEAYDKPDAGLWEYRTRERIHTYSAVLCWAACDRLANVAEVLKLADRQTFWRDRATHMRDHIEREAWNEDAGHFSASFGEAELDASLLQLIELGFLPADDKRLAATFEAVERGLRHGDNLFRYAAPDDFGSPETAFNFCTFWYIEALHRRGQTEEARRLFEGILSRRTPAGLLSEDVSLETGELWGNYPQTYSLVGIIACAWTLSRPWQSVR
ncbi:MAG: glycoside hydrolase family 15 protein [Burkholderiales bacterium]|nr:MAG: glycoside hydrolase family 15 protein [Burkholderiales bacterium]